MHFDYGMYWGFASQIIALSFIFIGIRQYRNNYGEGKITFGKAFSVGILITLIASVFYVLTWEVIFNNFAQMRLKTTINYYKFMRFDMIVISKIAFFNIQMYRKQIQLSISYHHLLQRDQQFGHRC